jgi:hypothetical protein
MIQTGSLSPLANDPKCIGDGAGFSNGDRAGFWWRGFS